MSCCGGGHTGNSARFWGGDEAWHLISEASSTTAALLHHRPLLSQYPTYLSYFQLDTALDHVEFVPPAYTSSISLFPQTLP